MTSYSTQDYNEDYIKWANQELTSKDETIAAQTETIAQAKRIIKPLADMFMKNTARKDGTYSLPRDIICMAAEWMEATK